MTKYLISGYIGFDNFGDEAILQVLTSKLKEINAEKITVLSSNPEKTAKMYNIDSEYFLNFFKPIFDSDVLISGGGSLLQDITSLKSLIYYLTVIVSALVLNKKVIIFAQGFTPFRTKIGKFLTKFVLKHCNKIYVRDKKSQEILKNLKLDSELISDPVFGINIPSSENKNDVGIQLRKFYKLSDSLLNKLADQIALNFSDKKIKLLSLQDSLDLKILEQFKELLKDKGVDSEICKNLSVNECIKEISSLEYLIGMRFHANLIGAKAGVKILGINYDIKVETLAQTIGFPVIELDSNNLEKEFKNLLKLDTKEYKIPEFIFPNFD